MGGDSATGGTLTATPPDDDAAIFDPTDMWYVPGSDKTGKPFSIDEITVKDEAGNTALSHLILMEDVIYGQIVILDKPDMPDGEVQLALEDMEGIEVSWEVVAGGGSIDANGVFSVDTESPYKYGVVSAYAKVGPITFNPFIILPVPIINIDDFRRAVS